MNTLTKETEKNALRARKCKLHFLSDYRKEYECEQCGNLQLQRLQIITEDENGGFVVQSFRCPACDFWFPADGAEEAFDRFLTAKGCRRKK